MNTFDSMFATISIFIGIYAFYGAYTGKGSIYKNEYPAEIKKDADKLLRTFLWIFAPVLLVQGVLDLTGHRVLSSILIGVVFVLITAYMIIFFKRFGAVLKKNKKKKEF